MRRILLSFILATLAACESTPAIPPSLDSQFTLTGQITHADHQTYREIPFTVPRGATRITIAFTYTGRENRAVIDLGLRDPQGQRGWSGGNKSTFTISEADATPSYFPGKLTPGDWRLVLGIPNIREGETSSYEAKVTITFAPQPTQAHARLQRKDRTLSREPGWRRGDFHAHTEHSDGSCEISAGAARIPCPLIETARAARDARLDFIAVTEHNTLSHRDPLARMQADFPGLLLIPGTEITTFHGHANAIGVSAPLDFQLGSPRLPTLATLLAQAERQGAFLSVNHPGQPSGEACMGCGWTVKDTDWSRVAAIEAVNGSTLRLGNPEVPTSGIPFWEGLLNQDLRITAIGGSDNHDATDREGKRQSPIGRPATVVYAAELSARGIAQGVKSGRVFIDLTNTPGSFMDAQARSPSGAAHMGGVLTLRPGETGRITFTAAGIDGGAIRIVSHNLTMTEPDHARGASVETTIRLNDGASFGWIRAEVRGADGNLLMLGNPVYVRIVT